MTIRLKAFFRDMLPKAAQVPVKYWSDRARGFLEPEMMLLQHLVKPGDRVIDVGGNRGIYAYHCWKLGAAIEVFEPNPVCLRVLEVWGRRRPRIALHAVALSNRAGVADLHIPVDEAGVEHDASASIEHHAFSQSRDQSITLRTLDSFGFKDAAFIKIDVEGHEYSVIEGATETLTRLRPALLVEIEQRHCARPITEVFAKVLEYGYRGYFLDAGVLRSIDAFNIEHDQINNNLGQIDRRYINNFLFLNETRCVTGNYHSLLQDFGAR